MMPMRAWQQNPLLVLSFAVRRGFLVRDRAWLLSLDKFPLTGLILAADFWLIARVSGVYFASMPLRDELTLALLAVGGTIVYALVILALFGRRWLVSLVRGEASFNRRTRGSGRSPPECKQHPHIS